jgi:voltage-gated potassium channel
MTAAAPVSRRHGNAYQISILVVTVLSLAVMVALLLPLNQPTLDALAVWDTILCFIFLGDFAYNLSGSRPRRQYFLHERGWLDLLGSIPSFGFFRYAAVLRLARLSRFARILRLLGGQNRKDLISDVVRNRSQYALFLTLLLVLTTVSVASVVMLQFESNSPDSNIKTGGDAVWWAVVTITTVGYGDRFPVTALGRGTAVFVMFAGIGIIGALASILASLLVSPPPPAEDGDEAVASAEGASLDEVRSEMAALRLQMAELNDALAASREPRSG